MNSAVIVYGPEKCADQIRQRLRDAGINIPVVSYKRWRNEIHSRDDAA